MARLLPRLYTGTPYNALIKYFNKDYFSENVILSIIK